MGRRASTGLSDTNSYASQKQLEVVLGQAANSRHRAPGTDGKSYNISSITPIRPTCDRYSGCNVEHSKSEASQEP